MGYRILAQATVVAHFGFLAYLTLGGFLAWRWPRALWPHVAVTVWGFTAVAVGVACPLTGLENWARERGGWERLPTGFINHYVEGAVYPADWTVGVRWLMGAAIVVSWAGVLLRHLRARRRTPPVPSR